jgi:hypothetical protein
MAKSIRSKSVRRNRAVKREYIFKPAADARLGRLAARGALVLAEAEKNQMDSGKPTLETGNATSPMSQDVVFGTEAKGARRKWRRNKQRAFSSYGLSAKETRF